MASTSTTSFTIENIQRALNGPLPGLNGQIKMAPSPVDGRVDRWQVPDNCRDAGVLLLLYPYASSGPDRDLHLVLTRRHEYIGVHSGQISLPGGRRETGESLQKTALRETKEEIGVVPEALQVVGQLSALYTPPSNFCIYPFVGYSDSRPAFRSDPREVAELIEVPFSLFADPTTCKAETWYFEKYGSRQVPFFEVFGHKIWGATAMILSEFLTLMLEHQTQT